MQQGSGPHRRIVFRCKNARLLTLRCDFICYENHIEGTDEDGRPVTLAYSDVEAVDATEASTSPVRL